LLDYIFANNIFRPEFINRFDGVIVFTSLTQSDLFQIAQLQLNKIAKNLKSKNKFYYYRGAYKKSGNLRF